MPFQILSLSGGGYLGLYTACVLAALEARFGAPIAARFDLIAGASVGGILALGLAAEVPAAELQAVFERDGQAIFSSRPPSEGLLAALRDLSRLLRRPKYTGQALRATIAKVIGAETTLGALPHACLIPTFCLSSGEPRLFHTGPGPDAGLRAVDVAMAAAAAPVYFPPVEIAGELHTDGGIYAATPDLLALHEVEHRLGVPAGEIHMLSIGTATARFALDPALGRQFGLAQWGRRQRLIRTLMASQQRIAERFATERLGARYVRLDGVVTADMERVVSLETATAAAQRAIRGMAEETRRGWEGDERLRGMMERGGESARPCSR